MKVFTSDIDSIMRPSREIYSARAAIDGGAIDPDSTRMTGDRDTDLFKNANDEMGKDSFLLLLVTQLKYQDPLNPMENTEFVAQLAQFRALESSDNIEKAVKELDNSFKGTLDAQMYTAQSVSNSSAVSLIGKEVRMRQTELEWVARAGETVQLNVHLGNSSEGTVRIVDKDGEVVRTLTASGKDAENSVSLKWDGMTDNGQMAQSGRYKIHIEGQEEDPSLYAFVQDKVAGVRFSSSGALVKIGGRELSIGDVLDVSMEKGQTLHSLTPSTAVSLMGKSVRVRQDTITHRGAEFEQHNVAVQAQPNQTITVAIRNSGNEVVRTLQVTTDSSGKGVLSWNGETNSGGYAEAGEYGIEFVGLENESGAFAFTEGRVDGLANLGGDVQLKVQGRTIKFRDILDISEVSV
ncbi:Flagellar basal-body rod modification protein FlgD [Chitinispirillum alkaliphilum]|nr:Flagellar basal-body rod modification protein FlgD [Chitinispirillum alkaliphilum]